MPPKKQTKTKFSKKSLLAALRQSDAPLRSKNIYGLFDADASLKKVIKSTLAQMVESLLDMQRRRAKDSQTVQAFIEACRKEWKLPYAAIEPPAGPSQPVQPAESAERVQATLTLKPLLSSVSYAEA